MNIVHVSIPRVFFPFSTSARCNILTWANMKNGIIFMTSFVFLWSPNQVINVKIQTEHSCIYFMYERRYCVFSFNDLTLWKMNVDLLEIEIQIWLTSKFYHSHSMTYKGKTRNIFKLHAYCVCNRLLWKHQREMVFYQLSLA